MQKQQRSPRFVSLLTIPVAGMRSGLGVSVLLNLGKGQMLGSAGNTNFWVDPQEALIGILMLQFMPSGTYPVIDDFWILTYQALVDCAWHCLTEYVLC